MALACFQSLPGALWDKIQCTLAGQPPAPAIEWRDDLLPELRRGRTDAEEAFLAQFWPLVAGEARRYGRLGGDVEELTGDGALALWEAAITYRPGRHRTSFTNYVRNQVHRRIRRAYVAERGYEGSNPTVVPLRPDHSQEDDALSMSEWSMDIDRAVRELSCRDQIALRLPAATRGHAARDKKRRQRAVERLRRALDINNAQQSDNRPPKGVARH